MFDLEAYVWDLVKNLFYLTLDALTEMLISVVSLFPDESPFPTIVTPNDFAGDHNIVSLFVSTLSWILPIQFFITCITALSTFYLVYFVVAPVLRWVKILK